MDYTPRPKLRSILFGTPSTIQRKLYQELVSLGSPRKRTLPSKRLRRRQSYITQSVHALFIDAPGTSTPTESRTNGSCCNLQGQVKAAVKIQVWWRGILAQKNASSKWHSALKIQRVWRRHIARAKLERDRCCIRIKPVGSRLPVQKPSSLKRKSPIEIESALPRLQYKRIKHTSTPVIGSGIPLLVPRSIAHLSSSELVKLTQQNTFQNRLYTCNFDRVIVRKKETRPPSPNPKATARAAAQARAQRKLRELELGYAIGPGDDTSWDPPQITPTRKAVKWALKLEEDVSHKLSDRSNVQRPKGCLTTKAKLDEFGNEHPRLSTPLKPPRVTIQKILYRGERDD